MSAGEWLRRNFAPARIELPPGLTDAELHAIADGRVAYGMSREAVFLAIGYPPKSLSPSKRDDLLTYEWKRWRPYRVGFGDDDRVTRLGR